MSTKPIATFANITTTDREDFAIAIAQFGIKGACAFIGWHALLFSPEWRPETLGAVQNLDLPHIPWIYAGLVGATALDIWWHRKGTITDWIHHIATLSLVLLTWLYGTNLILSYGCFNGVMETVSPFYQLRKVGFYPTVMRVIAICVNLTVRIPYSFWMMRRLWWDWLLHRSGSDPDAQVIPLVWLLSFGVCCVMVALDFVWTKIMVRSIAKRISAKA